jgi:hypothetical protein
MEEPNKEEINIPSSKGGENPPDEKVEEAKTEAEAPTEAQTTEPEPIADETEDIDKLPSWAQDRLKKAQEERDNLSKAVTRLNKERKLPSSEVEVKEEEEYPEWDETSKKFQKQTISQAQKIAEQEARKILESSNEKAAIEKFVKDNPDADWDEVISYYNPKSGKETVNGIIKDLNHAYVLARYEKGDLTKSQAEKQGKAKLADMSTVSKTTSKTAKGKPDLSPGALNMAERMRVSPEKLAQEDDSLTAEIKF